MRAKVPGCLHACMRACIACMHGLWLGLLGMPACMRACMCACMRANVLTWPCDEARAFDCGWVHVGMRANVRAHVTWPTCVGACV